jgi:hypothetical protein
VLAGVLYRATVGLGQVLDGQFLDGDELDTVSETVLDDGGGHLVTVAVTLPHALLQQAEYALAGLAVLLRWLIGFA